jgi:phage terminase large subunit
MGGKSFSEMAKILDASNYPKAQELFETVFSFEKNIIFYGGAIRGGKTFNLLGALVLLLRMFPGSRAAIIRKDFEMLKKSTLPSAKKVFPSNFLRLKDSSRYIWEADSKQYGAPLNGEVFFFGENYEKDKELSRFDGLEINFAIIDQIEGITPQGFSKVIERTGSYFIPGLKETEQPPPIILASLNPARNWVKSLVYDRFQKGRLPQNWAYIPAKITDNPFVPQSYLNSLEQLKLTSPKEYLRRVEGDWNYGDDPSALIDSEALEDMFSNDFKNPSSVKYISADVARYGRDKSIILVWKGFEVIDFEEISSDKEKKKGSTVYFENRVKFYAKKYNVTRSYIAIDADGIGGGPVDHLKCRGFVNNSRAIGKTIVQGKNIKNSEVYQNLKTQCAYLLAQKINQNILFWKNCPEEVKASVIEELSFIREETPGSDRKKRIIPKDKIKQLLGKSPDWADAIIIRMLFTFKKSSIKVG